MHAQEHNATENKTVTSPQICAFSIPIGLANSVFKNSETQRIIFLYV